jgi:lipid-A-disaccharide synthase
MKKIFICAGDVSGDLHAAYLVNKLLQNDPALEISMIGGKQLEQTKATFLYNIVDTESFGFTNLLQKYFYFKKIFHNIVCPILDKKPDLIILVDFYGFNIHIAKEAKKRNIKVIYYICPQIWASRFYRIKNIKKYIDEVIPIFPFEVDIYKKHGIKVYFTGNPLVDIIKTNEQEIDIYQQFNLSRDQKLIGVMPGSRKEEVKRILPMMLDCIKPVLSDKLKFFIFLASPEHKNLALKILNDYRMISYFKVIEGSGYSIRKHLCFCLTCSGTAVTENLILNVPMMVFYRMSHFTFLLAGLIVKIRTIGMPNILSGRKIVPEYIQYINTKKVAREIQSWIDSDAKIKQLKQDLSDVAKMLGQAGVLDRVAAHIST